jgi:hypothetical protein
MLKFAKKYIVPIAIGSILLFVLLSCTAKVAFYLGERHVTDLVLHTDKIPDGKVNYQPPDYGKSLDQLRSERDRISNDYDAACYNYQILYDAYDELYREAGDGHKKIGRPDNARGNEVSCYR